MKLKIRIKSFNKLTLCYFSSLSYPTDNDEYMLTLTGSDDTECQAASPKLIYNFGVQQYEYSLNHYENWRLSEQFICISRFKFAQVS